MKDYKEPTVEVIDLPAEDIITTSGGGTPSSTGSDTESEESGNLLGTFGGANGTLGGAKWQ